MVQISPKAKAAGLVGAAAIAATLFMPFEGLRLKANLDPVAIREICWGHTKGVTINMVVPESTCIVYLGQDTHAAEKEVDHDTDTTMTDKTKAAFISFVYNMGGVRFRASTMLRLLRAGDIRGACMALATADIDSEGVCHGYGCGWAGGVQLPGLTRRRESEKALCLEGLEGG